MVFSTLAPNTSNDRDARHSPSIILSSRNLVLVFPVPSANYLLPSGGVTCIANVTFTQKADCIFPRAHKRMRNFEVCACFPGSVWSPKVRGARESKYACVNMHASTHEAHSSHAMLMCVCDFMRLLQYMGNNTLCTCLVSFQLFCVSRWKVYVCDCANEQALWPLKYIHCTPP